MKQDVSVAVLKNTNVTNRKGKNVEQCFTGNSQASGFNKIDAKCCTHVLSNENFVSKNENKSRLMAENDNEKEKRDHVFSAPPHAFISGDPTPFPLT
jgi:hypothetical protein